MSGLERQNGVHHQLIITPTHNKHTVSRGYSVMKELSDIVFYNTTTTMDTQYSDATRKATQKCPRQEIKIYEFGFPERIESPHYLVYARREWARAQN